MSDRRNAAAMAADTTRATGAYLTRAEIDYLADQLAKLPGLEMELAVAVTGMRRSTGGRRSVPRSKPPYSIEMQALIDDLTSTLVTAIRDLCEQRALDYDGSSSISGMGKWLTRNRYGLQLIESGVESFHDLCEIITRCERAMAWSEQEYAVTPERVEAANRQVVTGPQVEKLAYKLGELAQGLNRKRVTYLRRRNLLQGWQDDGECHSDVDPEWKYYLGDVLAAHQKAKQYTPKKRVR